LKLLVFAHRLELGGTQINAIDLAAQLRDKHGFDVIVFATEGPALQLLCRKKLTFVPAPDVRWHPSAKRMKSLRKIVQQFQPDLIHAWDWWQGIEAYLGVHLPYRTPLVITDMMMSLTRVLPRHVPTTFGFEGLRQQADQAGWTKTHALLPPVDIVENAPDAVDGGAFRREYGVGTDEIAVVSVSRLAEYMKAESLVQAIAAMDHLAGELPLKLVIVGSGEGRPRLEAQAYQVNERLGRKAIVFTGALSDPRPAYAAADIVMGMGGSALRGLAFAKPVVVVGTDGFARTFSPQLIDLFQRTGMYGYGDGAGRNSALQDALRTLAMNPRQRQDLGEFGRSFVVSHHGLEEVASRFAEFCREAATEPPSRFPDAARSAYFYLRERRFRVPSRDSLKRAAPAGR
jgi:glycosyltransferase involved in cell wall biosynthesis